MFLVKWLGGFFVFEVGNFVGFWKFNVYDNVIIGIILVLLVIIMMLWGVVLFNNRLIGFLFIGFGKLLFL